MTHYIARWKHVLQALFRHGNCISLWHARECLDLPHQLCMAFMHLLLESQYCPKPASSLPHLIEEMIFTRKASTRASIKPSYDERAWSLSAPPRTRLGDISLRLSRWYFSGPPAAILTVWFMNGTWLLSQYFSEWNFSLITRIKIRLFTQMNQAQKLIWKWLA